MARLPARVVLGAEKMAPQLLRGQGIAPNEATFADLKIYAVKSTPTPMGADVFWTAVTNTAVGRDTDHFAFSLQLARGRAIPDLQTERSQRLALGLSRGLAFGSALFVPGIVTGPV